MNPKALARKQADMRDRQKVKYDDAWLRMPCLNGPVDAAWYKRRERWERKQERIKAKRTKQRQIERRLRKVEATDKKLRRKEASKRK